MRAPRPGITLDKEITPRPEHTADALGNPGIEVTATTALILFIEAVSAELIRPYLEKGEGSVGVRVEVDHLAPAFAGEPVSVAVTLDALGNRRLEFSAELRQGGATVMKGFHHRVVVPTERFSGKRQRGASPHARSAGPR